MHVPRPAVLSPRALLGYLAICLSVVAVALLLSAALGDLDGLARIVWIGAGLALGGLWAARARLPVLGAARTRTAVGGWLGVVLAGVVTVALAPTLVPAVTSSVGGAATAGASPQRVLRPAPPTAVRRTGTVRPVAQASAKPAASPSPPPAVAAVGTPDTGAAPSGPEIGAVVAVSPEPARSPIVARAASSPRPALPAGFDPGRYLGQGNVYECHDFTSQAEAQAVLRADPTDPNVIDLDRDGIACEANPPPRDSRRVPRPAS